MPHKPKSKKWFDPWKYQSKTPRSIHGYMPGFFRQSTWNVYTPPQEQVTPNFGTPTPGLNGVGPYIQEFSLAPYEAHQLYLEEATIAEILIDMVLTGTDPGSASLLLPYGTPGTLKPFFEMALGYGETWRGHHTERFGGVSSPPISTINPRFLNVKKPKRKKKKRRLFT